MKPIVWNSNELKKKHNRPVEEGSLRFLEIRNPEGDLDMLLSRKMLRHRYKAAKKLLKSARKHYKKLSKRLAERRDKLSGKKLAKWEKDLLAAKYLRKQAKSYYKLAKRDYKDYLARFSDPF